MNKLSNKRTKFTQTNVKSDFYFVIYVRQNTKVIPANKLGANPKNILISNLSVSIQLLIGPLKRSQIIKNNKESLR
ncbi:MAG: hypothetical protein ACI87N_003105 [Flavobacteriales bacterium]